MVEKKLYTFEITTVAKIIQTYRVQAESREEAERLAEEKDMLEFVETGDCVDEDIIEINKVD